jgi:hypothetical protein
MVMEDVWTTVANYGIGRRRVPIDRKGGFCETL